jgi:transposase, IS5 family
VGKQLRFLRRNLRIIDAQVASGHWDLGHLEAAWYKKLLVASEVLRQQSQLYQSKAWSIADRIVSVSQPHVRPIVRGKAGVPVEFGAKLSASWIHGFASLDRLSWDAYHEGLDLPAQAEAYRARAGHYPAVIYADKAYTTRANRAWCTDRGIRLAGTGPGRPPSDPVALRARNRMARDDEAARQPIEGIFGRGKRRWSLARIMAKLANTSATVIALVFLVMNLEAILLSACLLVLAMAIALLQWGPLTSVYGGFPAGGAIRPG